MLTETLVIFRRQMLILLRNPVWVFFGLTQPILYLVLFGPLLEKVGGGGLKGDDAWRVFVPGLLLQLSLFGAGFAGFGIIQELREGVIDRQRVTPARRLSLILGRTLQVMVTLFVQAVILILVAIPFGLDPTWDGILASIVLVCILSMGISAWSFAMGLILKDEDAFAPMIQSVTLPLLLLSGVLLPMTLAPAWLEAASEVNPLTHVVDAARALFRGDFGDSDVWLGTVIACALGGLLAWWGARTFARQSA
jgi:ABC-2 type transport system permease protein